MRHMHHAGGSMLLVIAVAGAALGAAGAAAAAQEGPVLPGDPFPALTLQVLSPGAVELRPLDLAQLIGKRPIVLVQFAIGNGPGEAMLLRLQELSSDLPADVDVMGVARAQGAEGVARAARRLGALGVKLPVIMEEGPRLDLLLGGTRSPTINLIDHQGILRVSRAGGLKQKVGAGADMRQAIRSAAARGPVPTAGPLEPYAPANDLIGEHFPDFKLRTLGTGEEMALSQLVGTKGQRVTALLFWHPDSAESFHIMSGVVSGAASYHKWIDVISVANLKDEQEVARAKEFVQKNAMTFPVLRDEGRKTQDRYMVGSLATMYFIRPDGVVDAVYTGTNVNYVPVFSVKIRRILKVGKEYEGGG